MAWHQRFARAGASAPFLAIPFIEEVSAHAGERHAANGLTDQGGLGMLAVVVGVGAAFWLADRAGQARGERADSPAAISASSTAEQSAPSLLRSPTSARRQNTATPS